MEYIFQMSESLATGFHHDRTSPGTVGSENVHRIDSPKIVNATKVALRQLAIGKYILNMN